MPLISHSNMMELIALQKRANYDNNLSQEEIEEIGVNFLKELREKEAKKLKDKVNE